VKILFARILANTKKGQILFDRILPEKKILSVFLRYFRSFFFVHRIKWN
jgi:hypothetical protein